MKEPTSTPPADAGTDDPQVVSEAALHEVGYRFMTAIRNAHFAEPDPAQRIPLPSWEKCLASASEALAQGPECVEAALALFAPKAGAGVRSQESGVSQATGPGGTGATKEGAPAAPNAPAAPVAAAVTKAPINDQPSTNNP